MTYEDGKKESFTLHKRAIVIGRSPQCDLQLVYEGISRRHISIEETFEGYIAQDLESANGVFINNERIDPKKKIAFTNKDTIKLGSTSITVKDKELKASISPIVPLTLDLKVESDRTMKASSYRANANKRPSKFEKSVENEEESSAYKNLLAICIVGAALLYFLINYVWKD